MDIVILGSGHVATQLAKGFAAAGHRIVQVYSRNITHAKALASLLGVPSVGHITNIQTDADLYLLAVADQAIAEVAKILPPVNGIVVHCSGATALTPLHHFEKHGVIYPPQSISKEIEGDLSHIPFAVEGNNPTNSGILLQLMQNISATSFACDTPQRFALHIAAVFANNFANALFQISYDLLLQKGLSFDLLKPIITETARKVQHHRPKDVQTGPAKRGDTETIQKHLDFINQNPDWVKIYQQLSKEIINQQR